MFVDLKSKAKTQAALLLLCLTALSAPPATAQTVKLVPDLTQGQDASGAIVSPGSYGGVRLQFIQAGSPFALAGIRVGDEVVKVGGRPTPTVPDFYQAVNAGGPSTPVEVRSQYGLYASYWVQLSGILIR